MSKESALVLLLCRLVFDKITKKRVEHIIKSGVNWYHVFEIATKEKVLYYVYTKLIKYNYFWNIPSTLKYIWQFSYLGNLQQNSQLLTTSFHLTNCFDSNKITCIPIRGIEILRSIKTTLDLQIINDIDFWYPNPNIELLYSIMAKQGYEAIYADDEDVYIQPSETDMDKMMFSKEGNSFFQLYINCDFTFKKNWMEFSDKELDNLSHNRLYIIQLAMLYISAYDKLKVHKEGDFDQKTCLSKLLDIELFENEFFTNKLIIEFQNFMVKNNMENILMEIDKKIKYKNDFISYKLEI